MYKDDLYRGYKHIDADAYTDKFLKTDARLDYQLTHAMVPTVATVNTDLSYRDWARDPCPKNTFVSSEEAKSMADFFQKDLSKTVVYDMPDMKNIRNKAHMLQEVSKSEREVWMEEQKSFDPATFDVLLATIERLKLLEPMNVSEENLNNILKGLLFSQEMFVNTSMDFFYQQHRDKYEFLFNRGSPQDKIIFQGSSAEGLSILRIDEILSAKS